MISRKVILTGNFGVGKTSLFNRFVSDTFSDKYLTTIGVKVNKKVVKVDGHDVSILLWDIAGEITQDKVPVSYFLGAAGVIYVFDLSRPLTFKNIKEDLDYLKEMIPDSELRIVGNKKDLLDEQQIGKVESEMPEGVVIDQLTSAKTGENITALFEDLARRFI